jgi:nanoRNase/pAp phosphatase (c-di-AMP/oligoRNAs hydrolase)
MDDIKAKQQIVEKIKSSANILVTVSNSPSVDALSAALGLTLLLDALDKHPTAVFSGDVPPAISFLKPEDTFDATTDSLRDFIIALDKEKADHLRYKVEGDSVKIFITPYKTTISSSDLVFTQGDFNVELVIALGVDVQEHLDGALESHGQILHDADIITVTAGEQVSNLGGIDWHDDQASSLSEMVSGLAEALKTDKKKTLLTAGISTALLTGIVAETDRFSNTHTTARAMTIAAQLMAAGADQQLIASELQESHTINNPSENLNEKTQATQDAAEHKETLSISHTQGETLEQMDKRVKGAEQDEHTGTARAGGAYAFDEAIHGDVAEAPSAEAPVVEPSKQASDAVTQPSFGGALNATSEQAAEDERRAVESDQNKTTLSHSYLDASDDAAPDAPAAGSAYVLDHDEKETNTSIEQSAPDPQGESPAAPAITTGHELIIQPLAATATSTPADFGLPMPPPLPDFSTSPVATSAYAPPESDAAQPERLGDILAPEPPEQPSPVEPAVAPQPSQPTPPVPVDPGQFSIPGQQ